MPVLTKTPSRILVTGCNGFLGAHVVLHLLQKGHYVKGVLRAESKAQILINSLPKDLQSNFTHRIIPDLTLSNCYENGGLSVLQDIDAIAHIASPLPSQQLTTTEEFMNKMIAPAVTGTLVLLQEALKHSNIKRIIIQSSISAIEGPTPVKHLSELDWNPITLEDVKKPNVTVFTAYQASKTIAEQTAWKFISEHPEASFDLVTLCPAFFFGPTVTPVESLDDIPSSLKVFHNVMHHTGKAQFNEFPVNYIDVRDLAGVYATIFQCPQAANQRYLVDSGTFTDQDIDELNTQNKPVKSDISDTTLDVSKAKRDLNWNPQWSKQQTFEETLRFLRQVDDKIKSS